MAINADDYGSRGWEVIPTFSPQAQFPVEILQEMEEHPEAPGKSSWGTRNVLSAFILSMRPKVVLEIGGHIGSASIVIGSALKANNFGRLYTLEPQEHYYRLLQHFVNKVDLGKYVQPLKMLSTNRAVMEHITEKVDIIFLDGSHTYSDVIKDLELCNRLIADNGLIFLDDVGPEMSARMCEEKRGGVRQALMDFTKERDDWQTILLEPPFWLNPCGMALVCKQRFIV